MRTIKIMFCLILMLSLIGCGGAGSQIPDKNPNAQSSVYSSSSNSALSGAWLPCTDGGGVCVFKGAQRVRYGANGFWVEQIISDALHCITENFSPINEANNARCEIWVNDTSPAFIEALNIVGTAIDLAAGKQVFDQMCLSCHGLAQTGRHAVLGSMINTVINTLNTMPVGDPQSCQGACAINTAAYYYSATAKSEQGTTLTKTAIAPQIYLAKAKELLTGDYVTAPELDLLNNSANPQSDMMALVDNWIGQVDSDGSRPFHHKINHFFDTVFSQGKMNVNDVTPQVAGADQLGNFRYIQTPIFDNLNQYVTQTLYQYIEANEPFTKIFNTTRWYMTTAAMSFFVAADTHKMPKLMLRSRDCDASVHQATQIINRDICLPTTKTLSYGPSKPVPELLYAGTTPSNTWPAALFLSAKVDDPAHALFVPSDYNDWRWVDVKIMDELTPENHSIEFFDAPRLRQSNTLYLRAPRPGFFTSPSFLETWRSNVDNQFRVTVNQAMIAATGSAFEDSDTTIPLSDAGIGEEHAAPGTDCFACHQHLDPMRNYFETYFDHFSGKPLKTFNHELPKSFSFKGQVATGDSLQDFADTLATHPLIAKGWVQKLCFYANSKACIETDSDFIAVVNDVKNSQFDLRFLFQRFFSSKLFTHTIDSEITQNNSVVSISRNQHFCHTLSYRLTQYKRNVLGDSAYTYSACNDRHLRIHRLSPFDISGGIPGESWPRGADKPLQPTLTSAFYNASLKELCARVAKSPKAVEAFPTQNNNVFTQFLVEFLLGIPKNDTRHNALMDVFLKHLKDASEASNTNSGYRSAFILACSSPLFASLDI